MERSRRSSRRRRRRTNRPSKRTERARQDELKSARKQGALVKRDERELPEVFIYTYTIYKTLD